MAKTSSVEKQKKRETMAGVHWKERMELKKTIRSLSVTEEERSQAVATLNQLPRNSSPVRLRNRCKITGRARGYLRKFQVSRLCFREMALAGCIPGMIKASW